MKHITLKREDHISPDIDKLYEMLADLKGFLDAEVEPEDPNWKSNINTILDFQTDKGDFSLLDSVRVESDARVEFCYIPTYICAAVMMKALMTYETLLDEKGKKSLAKALVVCCGRKLRGHGYDGLKRQIEAIGFFMQAGLREFLIYYPNLCLRFSNMIKGIANQFADKERKGIFVGSWGEDFESEIRAINHYFSSYNVFVYGTLMEGEHNHDYYLDSAHLIGKATLDGYEMYDLGSFPGIVRGQSLVKGELYEISCNDVPKLDYLEGEGSLYNRICVPICLESGNKELVFVYEYARSIDGYEIIPEWFQPYTSDWKSRREKYVWYVSYGSNMLYERFMHYIKGGRFENANRNHPACKDTTPPIAKCTYEIPYDMYFGNYSGSWGGKGVAFLDVTMPGKALGVAYLITKEQFRHVSCQENGGTPPKLSRDWYSKVVSLGKKDGCEVMTITNTEIRPYNEPSEGYVETVHRGIIENYSSMTNEETKEYLKGCIR